MRLVGWGFAFVAAVWACTVGARSYAVRLVADRSRGASVPLHLTKHVTQVEDLLWRGPAPGDGGYAELADAGVSLVVDLRSDAEAGQANALAKQCGLDLMSLPTENSRVPDPSHVGRFAEAYRAATGITYLHCQAGEGRTGAIVGAYRVGQGGRVLGNLGDALAVGSLSFSQLAYIATGGQMPRLLATLIEWSIDRPTEALFNLARR